MQKGRSLPYNFVQDQQKNINQLKQVKNKKENTKNEIPCMTFYETDTQCRAEHFKIKLGMNETESECNLHTVRKRIESAFHMILQKWIWSSVDNVMTKKSQHTQLWRVKACQYTLEKTIEFCLKKKCDS